MGGPWLSVVRVLWSTECWRSLASTRGSRIGNRSGRVDRGEAPFQRHLEGPIQVAFMARRGALLRPASPLRQMMADVRVRGRDGDPRRACIDYPNHRPSASDRDIGVIVQVELVRPKKHNGRTMFDQDEPDQQPISGHESRCDAPGSQPVRANTSSLFVQGDREEGGVTNPPGSSRDHPALVHESGDQRRCSVGQFGPTLNNPRTTPEKVPHGARPSEPGRKRAAGWAAS